MRLDSRLSQRDYLHYMRQTAHFRFDKYREGFSGLVIGSFFLLKYYAVNGSERDRLNKETRRSRCTYNAFGFVKSGDYGSEVLYMYTVGFLDPISVILLLLVGVLATLKGRFLFEEPGIAILIVAFLLLLMVIATTIKDSSACCAERGRKRILELLKDPSESMFSN